MEKQNKPAQLENRMGSLETKLDYLSTLINQYKALNLNPEDVVKTALEDKDLSLLLGREDINFLTGSPEEMKFRNLTEQLGDTFLEVKEDGNLSFCNSRIEALTGFSCDDMMERSLYHIIKPEYKAVFSYHFSGTDPLGDHIVFQIIHKSGSFITLEGQIGFYKRDNQRVMGMIIHSLSPEKELQNRLQKLEDNYDALSETVNEVIIRIDEDFNIIYSNSAMKDIFGYGSDEILGKNLSILFPPEILKRYHDDLRKYFYIDSRDREKMGMTNSLEILGRHKTRGISPMEISFGNTKNFEERTLTCIIRDITQRKNAERTLHKLAYYDQLTGLGNRDLFFQDMQEHFDNIQLEFNLSCLMFLDLDGFKNINDTLGHDTGDMLLKEAAKRLHDCLRESDSVYRLGGDEFLVLIRKIREVKDASKVAGNILNTIRMPFYLKRGDKSIPAVNVGVSIGIVFISEGEKDVNELTKKADLAMYGSKNAGKNRYTFYSEEMVQKINERWELEQGLKKAMAGNELEVHYQPIVGSSGNIRGLEALLRWYHPVMGLIPPDKFIPIAEETDLIVPIGTWVLEKSCQDITEWNNNGYENLYVTVNFSTKQFEQPDIIDTITHVIERTGCNPSNLKIELTETGIMQAPDETIKKMNLLKSEIPEIEILIDDFGTGYSSLSYLANLPTDILKIDLSFVSKLHDPNNRKVVNSIINLAESLEMDYVTEGIESEVELAFFQDKKCERMQGYYFSHPVSKDEIVKLLKASSLPLKE
ncbi:sensor domain-containing protein [Spirochaeta isovalerica]|uniref:Diguanylate cyclase (GGDEF)-like protein/PAS domain S-box-containing protein n=1 Tax=Spirochaeta isovalerica TaxID=150 RepID=A0A841R9R6_9SPIO|nr:bifunctional diguanylate cyclase/phosphodiesterase [Spirochaeta isovalerica]MBB6482094.1 diguanylate cyclase (GGDEF)-like protein/PAS domain S-box-containing protein [Spirochaeta isovalerica]